jgi:hypothetical protein
MKETAISTHILLAAFGIVALGAACPAQNFPDRALNYDPLALALDDTSSVAWLGAIEPMVEFGRYSNGSGRSHRWNGKIGLYLDVVRWDSTWSIAIVETMETVIDPNNDIAFNPRSIFWEEGILVSHRLGESSALQFGGMQRCKHDIDNLELSQTTENPQERTLIFSSATLRWLVRPHIVAADLPELRAGFAMRNELYVHLLDHRIPNAANESGEHLDRLVSSLMASGRIEYRPLGRRYAAHLSASALLSLVGGRLGEEGRFDDLTTTLGVPHLELGIDLFNPKGTGVTLFARAEWQRDAAILPVPRSATLVLFGIRAGHQTSIW